jgi:hypothetical protein
MRIVPAGLSRNSRTAASSPDAELRGGPGEASFLCHSKESEQCVDVLARHIYEFISWLHANYSI